MGDIYGKGVRGKATRLHAEIVRARGYCEAQKAHADGLIDWHPDCGGVLECSHIISRSRNRTRTALDNALSLCKSAHRTVGMDGFRHHELADLIYQDGHHADLSQRSNDMDAPKVYWPDELVRLEALAKQVGVR